MPCRIEKFAVGSITTELWLLTGPGGVDDLILAEPEVIELRDLLLERFPVADPATAGRNENDRAVRGRF